MGTHLSFSKAREEFDQACNNPDHTLLETAPVCLEIALYHTLGHLPEPEHAHRFC